MEIGKNIKRIREAKGMSAKEVISVIGMGAPMYSRIETGKTEPSLSSLKKIATALGITMPELFESDVSYKEVSSYDATLAEKLQIIETLNEEEKKAVFSIVDAFFAKKKLKERLNELLSDIG